MSGNDYLIDFIDLDEFSKTRKVLNVPDWVNPSNSSKKAYDAIVELGVNKKDFIHRHSAPSQFVKKSNYLITKAEVARMVGVNAQPLFNNVSYAKALTHFLDDVNLKLEESKSSKVSRSSGGLRQKRKEELVKELQSEKKNNESLIKEVVDTIYQRTLDNLSLDVKRKLKLD